VKNVVLVSSIMLKSCKSTETEVLTTISVDHDSRARYVSTTQGGYKYMVCPPPSPVSGGNMSPMSPGSDTPVNLLNFLGGEEVTSF